MIVSGVISPQLRQQRHQVANQELQEKLERFPREDEAADQKRNENVIVNKQNIVRTISESVHRGQQIDLYV